MDDDLGKIFEFELLKKGGTQSMVQRRPIIRSKI